MSIVIGPRGRVLVLASALAVVACGGDGDGGGGGGGGGGSTTTFTGVISQDDGSTSGSIEFVIQTASPAPPSPTGPSIRNPVTLTGTLKMGGTVTLTGTYDPDTDILGATGGGYDIGGGFDGTNRLEGFWTGPGGTSGTFVTTRAGGATAFCGTYDEDDDGSVDGTFSFVIAGSTLSGERYPSGGGGPVALDGVVNGNNITIYFPGTTTTLAVGTRNGGAVTGTFDDLQGTTGSWTGSSAACQ